MGKPLNGGLLIWRIMGIEGPFYSLCEFVRKIFAETHYKIDYLGMHVRVIKQRPQFFQCKFLIICSNFICFFLHDDYLERVVYGVLVLPHETLDHGLYGRERNQRIIDLDGSFESIEPFGNGVCGLRRKMELKLDDGHGAKFECFLKLLNIGKVSNNIAQSYKENL